MAEALLNVLLENLNSLIQKKIGSLFGVEKEMEKLSSTLSTICAVLEDAEERQLADRAIKNWLQKLTDVSSELDDILDDCEMEAFRLDYQSQKHRWTQKVRSSLSCFNPMSILFRLKIANKMKEIGDRLDQIAKERSNFHLREFVGERRAQVRESRQTSSIITQPHVYGREEDKERIVGFLINDAINCHDISIYTVVGLGGMGKTTLAQLVFNDERVKNHFELQMWVCVSEDFDMHRLIKAIIESATGSACEALDIDPLQKRLQDKLKGKRFFLVLDDVWNEDQEQWDKLKYILACGSNGASIVVTTRLKKVASFMGTVPMHHLSGLSEDDCWLLFKQRAFVNQREEQPNLVKIGKEIVRKCKGVPLAAKALGSLMCFKNEENEWLSIMQSELWHLPEEKGSILPALRLSYLHLPIEQRRCFAYCAIFPKDYEIEKERLIHLWMANGLISSKRGLEVEDIGNEILNELCWRSFLQDAEVYNFKNVKCFKMHDLVHDLAQSIMEDECHIVEVDDDELPINFSKRVRHLTCVSDTSDGITINIPNAKSLRTFMALLNQSTDCFYHMKLRSLRAFDAAYIHPSTSISYVLSNVKHLRYLNLSHSDIEILPDSVCLLHHLLILDLSYCYNLRKLPKHLCRLKVLRHLYIHCCGELVHLPPNIGRLTCLKTLTTFLVSKRKGCHLDELCDLNIGGFLRINNLEKVGSPMEAEYANLSGKSNLKELQLSWSTNENESQGNAEQVLEALAPCQNLTSLSIYDYKGIYFPYWFSNEILGHVVSITLSNCKNCSELPLFGKLTSLRDLNLSGMSFVQYIDNESHDGGLRRCFVCLESLNITDLPNLKRFSRQEGKEVFPRLRRLSLKQCPKLTLLGLGFACLEALDVEDLPNLEFSGPEGNKMFPRLSILYAKNCQKLTLLGQGFPCLKSLHMEDLPNLELSGPEGNKMFPRLSILYAKNCQKLTLLGQGFPCLERLHVEDLPNLELSMQDGKEMFPCLSELYVAKCPKLALPVLGSTKDLQVYEGSEEVLKSISNLHGLTQLRISDNDNMTSFPECMLQNLTSLRTFTIVRFPRLQELPSDMLIGLNALEALDISFCNELKCLPEGLFRGSTLKRMRIMSCEKMKSLSESFRDLTALQSLKLVNCPELEGFPTGLNNLSSLQNLTMLGLKVHTSGRNGSGCTMCANNKLVALPGALQHLPSVEVVRVSYFLELASLPDWLGNLATLKELCIEGCPDLASIPISIKNLTNLQKLTIEACPELEERFENETGEDWHKIAHIPDVYIGPQRFPRMDTMLNRDFP